MEGHFSQYLKIKEILLSEAETLVVDWTFSIYKIVLQKR
jgi:hypothetical protein